MLGALWCAVAFLILVAVAYGSGDARSLDANALHGFIDLQRPSTEARVNWIAHLGDPATVGLMALLLAGVGLARGRPRLAVGVIALLAATSISSQLLKLLLAYPRFSGTVGGAHVDPAAFPSGHSTAAMSVALAGVLVAPSRARPFAAVLGMGLALSVGLCVVVLGWHFPSDVLGGFLLAGGWTLAIAAALRYAAERWPERAGRTEAHRHVAPGRRLDHHRRIGRGHPRGRGRRLAGGPHDRAHPYGRGGGVRLRSHGAPGGGRDDRAHRRGGARRRDRRAAPRLADPGRSNLPGTNWPVVQGSPVRVRRGPATVSER